MSEAVEAGVIRRGLDGRQAAGHILSTIMFSAAYASTISGTEQNHASGQAEEIWEFVSRGVLAPTLVTPGAPAYY